MEDLQYLDFDLLIERVGRKYRARVLDSPAGPTSAIDFSTPVTKQALQIFLLTIGRPRENLRRIDTPLKQEVKKLGGRLYGSVFREQIRDSLVRSRQLARAQNKGLRIRLHLDSPALADLPWEYLYSEQDDSFLSLSRGTPVVRYLEIDDSPSPLSLSHPIQILTVISAPTDYVALDVEEEWRKLQDALRAHQESGQVRLERLVPATVDELQRALQLRQYHALHFVGHGGFREATDEGVLLFENEFREAHHLSGEDLGILLQDHPSIRLVVLNACEGARGSLRDPFSGTAQSLIRRGVPAVVAMQFEITDSAAIRFSRSFYAALAAGFSVDSAVSEARKSIRLGGNDTEWGTPVLYMIASDGRVFDLPAVEEPLVQEQEEPVAGEEAEPEDPERLARKEAEREEADRVEAERLARAEAQRDEAQRQAAQRVEAERLAREDAEQQELVPRRTSRGRRIAITTAAAVLVLAAAIGFVLTRSPETDQAGAAVCGEVKTVPPYPSGRDEAHIPPAPALSTYPSTPPTSGPHAPGTVPAGVYTAPQNIYAAIHSLEHGAVIIWYQPEAAPEVRELSESYSDSPENDHVIVMPYNYPDEGKAGRLPVGTKVALVSWHHLQSCSSPNLEVAEAFVERYRLSETVPEPGAPI